MLVSLQGNNRTIVAINDQGHISLEGYIENYIFTSFTILLLDSMCIYLYI